MVVDFCDVLAQLRANPEPEDMFGVAADEAVEARYSHARGAYRRLARLVHPDRNDGSPEATEAFRLLEALWARANRMLAAGIYGTARSPTITVRTKRDTFQVGGVRRRGEIADVFDCSLRGRTDLVFKAARVPRDNDLLLGEARTLRRLRRELEERWQPFLPDLVDHVNFRAPGGIRRAANVLTRLDGWYTLAQVVDAYPLGLDARDVAWMWRRLLAILGAVHEAGIVHGAVVPSNVLIHPEKHGLVLADWCYAFAAGGRPLAVSRERWRYPDEVNEKRLTASSDLYTASTTAWSLLTGRAVVGNIPERVPKPLRAHLRAYLLDERQRPTSAWQMLGLFEDVLERCYGPRRFRPFTMPATT